MSFKWKTCLFLLCFLEVACQTPSTALNHLHKHTQAKCLHATVKLHPHWQLNDFKGQWEKLIFTSVELTLDISDKPHTSDFCRL